MKKPTLMLIFLAFFASGVRAESDRAAHGEGAQELYRAESQQSFRGPEEWFTGEIRVDMLFPSNDTAHYSGAYVTFGPGARTAWHLHPAGQHMIVTSGVALTGTRDGRIIRFEAGDTVWCPAHIDHWHGATPEAAMTHLVITGSKDGQNVIWKEKVTDEQYLGKAPKSSDTSEEKTVDMDKQLSKKQQAMIPIAAFAASGDLEELKRALHEGLDAGLTVNETKEILIHLYAYAGFPRSLNALGALMAVLDERKAKGITDEMGADARPLPAGTDSLELGTKVQTDLVGRPVSGPLFDFAPVMNEYLQSHLFGDIFGRDVLDHRSRELVTVSALANMEGVAPQLQAHIAMSLNAGLTAEQIKALVVVFENTVGRTKYDLASWLPNAATN